MRSQVQSLGAFRRLKTEIEKDRNNEIARHQRSVAAVRLRRLRKSSRPLNILAEGDSWFNYPFYAAIPSRIASRAARTPLILNLAHWGDVATEMLGFDQRQRLIQQLQTPANGPFDALLFSAGGNDFAGNPFCLWLKDRVAGMTAADAVDLPRFTALLTVVRAAYEDLVTLCAKYQPACVIFVYGYDYALPNGVPACPGVGPWLRPSLTLRGCTDFGERKQIIRIMLDAMGVVLADLATAHPGNVVLVPTLGTLRQTSADWDNEMHPKATGFDKLADVFLDSLRGTFPGRI